MFRKTCLKLAGIYLLAIMLFSAGISVWIYQLSTHELKEGLSVKMGIKEQALLTDKAPAEAKQLLNKQLAIGQQRVIMQLLYFNGAVLLIAGPGSYWLAWRMLRPIDKAMRTQNQFTADASHELRTPLATMKSQLELALLEQDYSKATMQALLKSNLEEVNQLAAMTENLLVLANDTAPPQILTQLDAIVERSCSRLQPLAQARQIMLHCRVYARPVMIMAAELDIERLLTILIDNALKYSPKKTTVKVSLHTNETHAQLRVQDQGYGIPADELPHIFDRFYRVSKARTSTHAPGHGLGLAIAQKIVTEHHGTLTVSSSKNQGSVFAVQFPKAAIK